MLAFEFLINTTCLSSNTFVATLRLRKSHAVAGMFCVATSYTAEQVYRWGFWMATRGRHGQVWWVRYSVCPAERICAWLNDAGGVLLLTAEVPRVPRLPGICLLPTLASSTLLLSSTHLGLSRRQCTRNFEGSLHKASLSESGDQACVFSIPTLAKWIHFFLWLTC